MFCSGIVLSASLKALGVDSLIIDRHPQPGDNWRLRYDCMRFHVAKSYCETPYLCKCPDIYLWMKVPKFREYQLIDLRLSAYPQDDPLILTREMLANHMKNYVATFNLTILNSSTVEASSFTQSKGTWRAKIATPYGVKSVVAKHLVQATGIACQNPYVPNISGKESYSGICIHSTGYKNPKQLIDEGAKVRSPLSIFEMGRS